MPIIIDDVMSTHVVSVTMDTWLRDIGEIFDDFCFHHVVVNDEKGKAVGIISDRDLLKTVSPFIGKMAERPQDVSTLRKRAHQVMTRVIVSVPPGTDIRKASFEMLLNRISCLPVVDDEGRCVGIVSWRDLLTALVHMTHDDEQGDQREAA